MSPEPQRAPLGKTVEQILEEQRAAPSAAEVAAWAEADEKAAEIRQLERAESEWAERIPRRFRDARLNDFDFSGDAAIDQIIADLDAWADQRSRSNVVILGPVGVGKTHLAVGAARLRHFNGEFVSFWPVVELLDALRPGGDETAADRARDAAVLVLDDLGAERPTDWTAERMYALVNRRWLDERPIICTTNLPVEDLNAAVGPRLYSRLAHDALPIRLAGKDRRRA